MTFCLLLEGVRCHMNSGLKCQTTEVLNADFFRGFCCFSLVHFKNMNWSSWGSEESLTKADGLWSVIFPLSAWKLMNEIVEESQRSVIMINTICQWYQMAGWVTSICCYPPWYPFHKEVMKDRRMNKHPKTCKCCNVRIARRNLSGDPCCRFQGRLIYLLFLLPSFTWACSTLEGWHISASSHVLCSPIFHIQLK